jgi:hypothetical protein
MELIGRQHNSYIVKHDNQHFFVNLSEKSAKPITEHEIEMIVKHGYWTDDFDPKHTPELNEILGKAKQE